MAYLNIPCVPLKGPVVDAMCYGNRGLRYYGDLDILVPLAELKPAVAVLRDLGFSTPKDVLPEGHTMGTIVKPIGTGDLHIDVHLQFDFTWRSRECPTDYFARSMAWDGIVPGGLALSLEDTVLHQLVHLYKDEAEFRVSIRLDKHRRLQRRLDVALLSRLPVDWDRVLSTASRYGLERGVLYAIGAAREAYPEIATDLPSIGDGGWFLFANRPIPWGVDWPTRFFHIDNAVPVVRDSIRHTLMGGEQGAVECMWTPDGALAVSSPIPAGSTHWVLWVETDDDEHLYIEVVVDLASGTTACDRVASTAVEAGRVIVTMDPQAWPLTAYEGREIGVWSRWRSPAGDAGSEERFSWVSDAPQKVSPRAPSALKRTWDGLPIAQVPPFGVSIIVFARRAESIVFLLLHRAHLGAGYEGEWAWGPPSGARLPGERVEACATRELREECGLEIAIRPTAYGNTEWSVYVGEVPQPCAVALSAEHDRHVWANIEEVRCKVMPEMVAQTFESVLSSVSKCG
jgi:8-oxo-dGTP pyrophosphatase MutT (NUDIX family)